MEIIKKGEGKNPGYILGKTVINGNYEDVGTVIDDLGDFKDLSEGRYVYIGGQRSYYYKGKVIDSFSRGTLDKGSKRFFKSIRFYTKPLTENTTEVEFEVVKRNLLQGGVKAFYIVLASIILTVAFGPVIWGLIKSGGRGVTEILILAFGVITIGIYIWTCKRGNSAEGQLKFFDKRIISHINWQLKRLQDAKEKMRIREEKAKESQK